MGASNQTVGKGISRRALADDDGALEPRVRILEVSHATIEQKVDSLFDNGSPGILSQIRNALMDKIDSYGETVSKFIEGEPARKAHIERNMQQAVLDAKEVARQAQEDAERETKRLHEENKRKGEKTDEVIARLQDNLSRHEKFVQRGIGALILGQIVFAIIGVFITVVTFIAGAAWWIFTHIPITK